MHDDAADERRAMRLQDKRTIRGDRTIDVSTTPARRSRDEGAPSYEHSTGSDPIVPSSGEEHESSYAEFIARYGAAEPDLSGDFAIDAPESSVSLSTEADADATQVGAGGVEEYETPDSADPSDQSSIGEFPSSYAEFRARCEAARLRGCGAIDGLETPSPNIGAVAIGSDVDATQATLENPCAGPLKTSRRRRGDRRSIAPNYRWLTYQEAADYAGWTIEHLRNLVSAGKIPVYGKARVRRFRQDMLDLFLADPDTAMRRFSQEKEMHHGR